VTENAPLGVKLYHAQPCVGHHPAVTHRPA